MRQRLSELYESDVKPFVSPDPSKRDEMELRTTEYMAWVPLICTATLLYSGKLLGKYGPDPENLDRNLMWLKITMWVYAFVELVIDKNMVIKRGPALYIAIIFCACDMLRFQMEVMRLIYDDEELEEEVDRLANMVIEALENDDDEMAFKHAVREVIQRNRESNAAAMQKDVEDAETIAINSPHENHTSPKELQEEEDDTTKYGTLAIHNSPK